MKIERHPLQNKLVEGSALQGIELNDHQIELLLAYLELFNKWNKAYNLSAVRNIDQMLGRHILDSLSVVPYIQGQRFVDVGTGGGLPGIPLAIIFPEKHFTLLDSNGKKSRFQFQAVSELGLKNVAVHNGRVEEFLPEEKFDGVISRAFASLKDMVDGCQHLLKNSGLFFAMKGLYPEDELRELGKNYKVSASYPLLVPNEIGERHLLIIGSEQ